MKIFIYVGAVATYVMSALRIVPPVWASNPLDGFLTACAFATACLALVLLLLEEVDA